MAKASRKTTGAAKKTKAAAGFTAVVSKLATMAESDVGPPDVKADENLQAALDRLFSGRKLVANVCGSSKSQKFVILRFKGLKKPAAQ